MSERNPALDQLDVLVGTWSTENRHRLVDEVVTGEVTYEWLEGGHYLVERSHVDHELFPDAICVIGAPEDGDGLVKEYFDSRGVRRTYRVAVEDGALEQWRDVEGFDQRSTAKLAPDGFEVLVELAESPGEWVVDLRVVYRRSRR